MNSFTFYPSYFESAQCVDEAEQGAFYKAIIDYAFTGVEPQFQGALKMAFILVKPNIDKSIKKSINGFKQNKNQTEPEPNTNTTQTELKQNTNATPLYLDNNQETDKDKGYLLVKEIFKKYSNSSKLQTELFDFFKIKLTSPNFWDYHKDTIYGELTTEVINTICSRIVQAKEKTFVYEGEKYDLEKMITLSLTVTVANVEFIVKSLKNNKVNIKNRELYIFSSIIQQVRQCQ